MSSGTPGRALFSLATDVSCRHIPTNDGEMTMHPVLRIQTALPEQRVVVDTVEAGQDLGGGMTAESQVYLADATGRVFSYATAHGALWPGPLGGGADCGPRRRTGGGASRHPASPAAVWWVLRAAGALGRGT
jgi:hypothetical protein